MSQISIAPVGGGSVGNVTGPGSSTDNAIATFDGATGTVIQSSGASVSDAGVITSTGYISTDLVDQGVLFGNSTGQIDGVGSMTDGQIAIGVTGGDPVAGTITAGSNITIVNSAGGITISSTGGANLMFTADSGTATSSSDNINFLGTNGLSSSASGSTVTYTIATATAGATAGAATAGSASFDSTDFDVTAGFVSLVTPIDATINHVKNLVAYTDCTTDTGSQDNGFGYVNAGQSESEVQEAGHPGILISGNSSTSWTSNRMSLGDEGGTFAKNIMIGSGEITMELIRRWGTAPVGGQFFFGLTDNHVITSLTDNVGFYISDFSSSANYVCETTKASTATTTDSGVAAGTSWQHLKIVINAGATSVAFYIDGALEATHTDNIPLSTTAMHYMWTMYNTGVFATYPNYTDLMGFQYSLTGDRA